MRVQELLARRPGALRLEVGPHDPRRFEALHRVVDEIAGDDRLRPLRRQPHAHVIRRVAGRRFQPHLVVERKVGFDDRRLPRLQNRVHAVDQMRLRRLVVQFLPALQFAAREDVLRVGEGGHPAPVAQLRVPADVIRVQVGAEHVVDVLGRHPGLAQQRQEGAELLHVPARAPLAWLVVAHARVDDDGVVRGLDQERLEHQHQVAGGRIHGARQHPGAVRFPILRAGFGKKRQGLEIGADRFHDAGDADVAELALLHGRCFLLLQGRGSSE